MAGNVRFEDNTMQVIAELDAAAKAYLYEAAESLTNQVAENTPVGSGQLSGAWTYKVDEEKGIATVGNPLENAIWTEFGTGEYALEGNGRKGGWSYQDDDGKWHFTMGKRPVRMLHNAFNTLKPALIRRAEQVLNARMR